MYIVIHYNKVHCNLSYFILSAACWGNRLEDPACMKTMTQIKSVTTQPYLTPTTV